ncbi:MAG TPA: winged helix-turn-helix domain-containing protein [Candidatus Krumholzibacterium sp.]|nr:winged helix-turn-helix domain-containing protein [Candidatus Krumholzibacterium sp.]
MLEQLFGSKLRVSALSWLVLHPDQRYFVRQLERILGADSANLSRELSRLEKAGLLASVVEGRQKYYSADRSCPIFPELRDLIRKDLDLPSLIRGSLAESADRINIAFLSGNKAGKHTQGEPDREIVVIGTCGRKEIEEALAGVEDRYGLRFRVTVMSPSGWAERIASGDRFATSLAARDRQYVIGDDDSLSGMLIRSRLTEAIETWVDRNGHRDGSHRGI